MKVCHGWRYHLDCGKERIALDGLLDQLVPLLLPLIELQADGIEDLESSLPMGIHLGILLLGLFVYSYSVYV